MNSPHGSSQHIGQLSVRETFQLAEHEQFTKTIWQAVHGLLDHRSGVCVEQ
jgi:hypothetical protein